MTSLSVARDGRLPFTVAANPIFVLSELSDYRAGGALTFEVLESDSDVLKTLIGVPSHYVFADNVFAGVLASLAPCESTAPALSLLRDRPAFRGVLTIFDEVTSRH